MRKHIRRECTICNKKKIQKALKAVVLIGLPTRKIGFICNSCELKYGEPKLIRVNATHLRAKNAK